MADLEDWPGTGMGASLRRISPMCHRKEPPSTALLGSQPELYSVSQIPWQEVGEGWGTRCGASLDIKSLRVRCPAQAHRHCTRRA